MQNRYAADVGDFGKFQLLRYLFKNTSYSLSQLWYMYPDESHNSDGMYIDYFEKVKGFDEELESSFKTIIQNNRNVKALEKANLLKNTKFFSDIIYDETLFFRKEWFKKALSFSKNSDVILTDADNGIATKCDRVNKTIEILDFEKLSKKPKSGKYIFYDEIQALVQECKCLIVYHHLNRCFAHDLQIEVLKDVLEKEFQNVIAIKHKPYSPRVYFFLCSDDSIFEFVKVRLKEFENSFSLHWKLF